MNSIPMHRIFIGVAVIAVAGVAISVVTFNAKHDTEIARSAAVAPLGENATGAADTTAPALSAPAEVPADSTATTSSPVVTPSVATPAVVASTPAKSATRDVAKASTGSDRNANSNIRVASAALTNNRFNSESSSNERASAPPLSEAPASAPAETQPAPAAAVQEAVTVAVPAATSNDLAASDSQITSDVKSEIAAAAPNSNVGVTTTNGVVALAGSVPSQDAVEQARQAARGVAGVRSVDVSALTVSNQ
jgi:hyperosmotically inducible periplasmic protein